MYDEFDDENELYGGEYDGDVEHDMWVDYDTDMYENTDYTGENTHYHDAPTYHPRPSMSVEQYESRIHELELLLAAALASGISADVSRYRKELSTARFHYNTAKQQRSDAITGCLVVGAVVLIVFLIFIL